MRGNAQYKNGTVRCDAHYESMGEERRIMEFVTAQEMAEKWGVSVRYVQTLCQKGRVAGAVRRGRDWMIPADALRPADGRTRIAKSHTEPIRAEQVFPRRTPLLLMTDLYNIPGGAEECIERLEGTPNAKRMLAAQIDYARGEIDKVYENTAELLYHQGGFYETISVGMLLSLCAIWRGDLILWRRAKIHISSAPANTDAERDIISFSITAVDSMLYDVSSFPEWFKIGCFEPLHRDSLPAAKVFFGKYLYAAAYAVAIKEVELPGIQGLGLMSVLPPTLEVMISQAVADNSIVAEIYLRLTCATIYHNGGDDAQAIRHIDRAISLALPDRLLGTLAEYIRVLGPLIEQRLLLADQAAWNRVKILSKNYLEGWAKLSGTVRGRNITTLLSPKERQVAKLAAFGMSNKEIAEKLHMSLSGVKQAVRIVSEKTGMRREEFAAIL